MCQCDAVHHDEQVHERPGHRVARVGDFEGDRDKVVEGNNGVQMSSFRFKEMFVKEDFKLALLDLRPHVGHFGQ